MTRANEAAVKLGAGCKHCTVPSPGIPRPRPGCIWYPSMASNRSDVGYGGMWLHCMYCAGTGVATEEKK